MHPIMAINRKILNEIDSEVREKAVKDLARALLEFELENWGLEKVHFKEFFEKQIILNCGSEEEEA